MGSYSGSDSTNVYLNLNISKGSNIMLGLFEDKEKSKTIDVWIKDDKIEKFYLHDLSIDLKDKISEQVTGYLINYYETNGNILEEAELLIEYKVSGYYDPGRISGPPEHCYPPESDEEREVEFASLILDKDVCIKIPSEYMDKIYDAFDEEINKNEFNPEPEYDY